MVCAVKPGRKQTFRFAVCFYRAGQVTTGLDTRYHYTRHFDALESVAAYALGNFGALKKRGDAFDKKVAKARNLTIQGVVNYQGTEQIRKTKDLNPKLAKRLVREELARNPGMRRADAVEAVRQKHIPSWKKKGK